MLTVEGPVKLKKWKWKSERSRRSLYKMDIGKEAQVGDPFVHV